jgi:hypothetical protein
MIVIILLILIIFICKHIYELHNINYENNIYNIQTDNKEDINEKLRYRNPIIFHNLGNQLELIKKIDISYLINENPGYIIKDNSKLISLESFNKDKMNIYKNEYMSKDLNLTILFDKVYESFNSKIHCNKKYYLTLLKGLNGISLKKNKHNLYLIYQISGINNIYIFNPKYKDNIFNKKNDIIKKWGIKIKLTPGLVILIPTEWYYIYETESDESIIGEIESDNYFTVIYNLLRD